MRNELLSPAPARKGKRTASRTPSTVSDDSQGKFNRVLDRSSSFRNEYPNQLIFSSSQFLEAIADSAVALKEESKGDVTKHSVDRPLKADPATIALFLQSNPTYSISLLEHSLGDLEAELEENHPGDWDPVPNELLDIPGKRLREWALALNGKWKELSRVYREEVRQHPKRFSCIPVPRPFIIPGGRFRELYYWDSYWVVIGLCTCGMVRSAHDIVENFFYLIDQFGFIPNGTRVYYLNRSQPPLLSEMVKILWDRSRDKEFLARAVERLDIEYQFWMQRRSVALSGDEEPTSPSGVYGRAQPPSKVRAIYEHVSSGSGGLSFKVGDIIDVCGEDPVHCRFRGSIAGGPEDWFPSDLVVSVDDADDDSSPARGRGGGGGTSGASDPGSGSGDEDDEDEVFLNRYYANIDTPRPESYLDDQRVTEGLAEESKKRVYRDIAAACESGWDFSSRWCRDPTSLDTAITSQLIPVDLNCILLRMERNLAAFHEILQNPIKGRQYRRAANKREAAIRRFLWNPATKQWHDYNFVDRRQNMQTFASNFYGMWAGLLDDQPPNVRDETVEALLSSGLVGKCGVATSVADTDHQWDFPNAWPPVQDLIVRGLERVGTTASTRLAQDIVQKWLLTNLVGFSKMDPESGQPVRAMHEKYHVEVVGERGQGGEYEPQVGFGWSNAVCLAFIRDYASVISDVFQALWVQDEDSLDSAPAGVVCVDSNEGMLCWRPIPSDAMSESSEGGMSSSSSVHLDLPQGRGVHRVQSIEFRNKSLADAARPSVARPIRRHHFQESPEARMKRELDTLAMSISNEAELRRFVRHMAVFQGLFRRFMSREHSELRWDRVRPPSPSQVLDYETLPAPSDFKACRSLLQRLVVLKLNGGLGTSMGLSGPKCALEVRQVPRTLTILDMTVAHIRSLNKHYDVDIPLVLMNSFHTTELTEKIVRRYQEYVRVLCFDQKRCPRIDSASLSPLPTPETFDEDARFAPIGHGDVYDSFLESGHFATLKAEGKQILLIGNIDNLGSTVDMNLLNWFKSSQAEFCMEVTRRTRSDRSGGTLIDYDGKLRLLELAEVEALNNLQYTEEFRSMQRFSDLNTNNLWVKMDAIERVAPVLNLNVLVSSPTVTVQGPTGPQSVKVIQLETPVGGAIDDFAHSKAVRVSRDRYVSVKSCSDLFLVQSDLYELTEDWTLAISERRRALARNDDLLPVVQLGECFESLADYRERVPHPLPNILELTHLSVIGDVHFGNRITLKGNVLIIADDGTRIDLPERALIEDRVVRGGLRITHH